MAYGPIWTCPEICLEQSVQATEVPPENQFDLLVQGWILHLFNLTHGWHQALEVVIQVLGDVFQPVFWVRVQKAFDLLLTKGAHAASLHWN